MVENGNPKQKSKRFGRVTIGFLAATIVAFGVGFLVGYFALRSEEIGDKRRMQVTANFTANDLVQMLNVTNIEANVRYFSSEPHWAGSRRQAELAEDIRRKWEQYGFDVDTPEYEVPLTVPNENNPDYIEIVDGGGTVNYLLSAEAKADPGDKKTWTIPRYFFYSPSGIVQGGLIYANKGRLEDFERLKQLNVTSCNGSIVLVQRFSPTIRTLQQVKNALKCNASGLLVFDIPKDVFGWKTNDTYPNNIRLPEESPIVDSLKNDIGDHLTPELPAISGTYRLGPEESELPVKLPVQLIEYSVAQELLSRLEGSKVPDNWTLGNNTEYRVGPHLSRNATLRLVVNTKTTRRKIYNVIGTVVGWDKPDHWVLLGNHRDAMSFGAADAVSGTAGMMELSRVIGELLSKGWRPRRTIKFCNWAAEETGLIGSTEWVEEYVEILRERAVAYINIDWFVNGNYTLKSNGNPMFTDLIYSLTKLVNDPHRPGETIYSTWRTRKPANASDPSSLPEFYTSGRGTDYQSFYEFAGVPSLDLQYLPNRKANVQRTAYHTPYDTYHMAKLFDHGFTMHLAQTQLVTRILFNFTESILLPFNLTYIWVSLDKILQKTEYHYTQILREQNITLKHIREEANLLGRHLKEFERLKANSAKFNEQQQRRFIEMLNRRTVVLNKMFLSRVSFNRSPLIRNVLHGINKDAKQRDNITLPAIADAIEEARHSGTWSVVKYWISVTNHCIVQARKSLMVPVMGK